MVEIQGFRIVLETMGEKVGAGETWSCSGKLGPGHLKYKPLYAYLCPHVIRPVDYMPSLQPHGAADEGKAVRPLSTSTLRDQATKYLVIWTKRRVYTPKAKHIYHLHLSIYNG